MLRAISDMEDKASIRYKRLRQNASHHEEGASYLTQHGRKSGVFLTVL